MAGRRVAPEGVARPQPRLRRHAAPLRHGHRLREGRGAAALRGEPARAGRRLGPGGNGSRRGPRPRDRDLLRRDRGRGRRGRPADPLERRVEPGRDPRPLRRRRAGARLAPPHREHRPGHRGRHEGVGGGLPRPRRGRGDPGAGARGLAARGRPGGQGDRPRARQAARARAPRGGARRGRVPRPRRPPAPRARPRRLRRAHEPLRACPRRASTGSSGGRGTTRPARRSTRWRSSSASATPAGRSSTGWPRGRTTRRWSSPSRASRTGARTSPSAAIKTAVLLHVKREGIPPVSDPADVPPRVRDLVASFQRAVVDRPRARAREGRPRAPPAQPRPDRGRRRQLASCAARRSGRRGSWGCPSSSRPSSLTTDNAAMIAAAGFVAFRRGARGDLALNAEPHLPLG